MPVRPRNARSYRKKLTFSDEQLLKYGCDLFSCPRYSLKTLEDVKAAWAKHRLVLIEKFKRRYTSFYDEDTPCWGERHIDNQSDNHIREQLAWFLRSRENA